MEQAFRPAWTDASERDGLRMQAEGLLHILLTCRTAPRSAFRSGIRPDLAETVERILTVLDAATTPQALDVPRYRLHRLKGDLEGLWSVTVRANWRIMFRFEGTDAFDVELIDYH